MALDPVLTVAVVLVHVQTVVCCPVLVPVQMQVLVQARVLRSTCHRGTRPAANTFFSIFPRKMLQSFSFFLQKLVRLFHASVPAGCVGKTYTSCR